MPNRLELTKKPAIRLNKAETAGSSLVGTAGFEPTTPCTPCKCATGLRHVPSMIYKVKKVLKAFQQLL